MKSSLIPYEAPMNHLSSRLYAQNPPIISYMFKIRKKALCVQVLFGTEFKGFTRAIQGLQKAFYEGLTRATQELQVVDRSWADRGPHQALMSV